MYFLIPAKTPLRAHVKDRSEFDWFCKEKRQPQSLYNPVLSISMSYLALQNSLGPKTPKNGNSLNYFLDFLPLGHVVV